MHTHVDEGLGLREIILKKKPRRIVECGAGKGELTAVIAHLQDWYPFEFHCVSDNEVQGLDRRIKWHRGLSYNVFPEFEDNSIDLCIIDTDHNYWTLMKELLAVKDKITENGLIAFHDVDEFYHNTGMAMSYWTDEPYPEKSIKECAKFGGTGLALLRFLVDYPGHFKLLRWTDKNYGAALIERKSVIETQIVMPGGQPTFAKPYAMESVAV